LTYKDFENNTTTRDGLSKNHMIKFWGSFKNMINELGLKLTNEMGFDKNLYNKL